MTEQPQRTSSSHRDTLPWWIRLCRWLWKLTVFLGTSVLLALGINVASTWLTTPNGSLPANTPLGDMMKQWPLFLLAGCCLFLLATFFWAISRENPPTSVRTVALTSQDRERMLRRLRIRYEQGVAQSLQGSVQIELGLAERPDAIENTIGLSLRLPAQVEQPLPPHTSIIDAYNQAQQELLILGEPGAGKSMQLLELASHLVKQAEQNAEQPLPVLLPLSSWAVKHPPLQNWMIEQFALLYDIPQQLSQQWIQAELVLPLLDGLDEMEETARPGCIAAINVYHREHLGPLVVCSRTHEYEGATKQERLALNTSVVVQLLSFAQVDAYLKMLGKPLAGLSTAMKKQPFLREIATTPLMLQVLILTYHGISVRALSPQTARLQSQIWTDYVQRMISRTGNSRLYSLQITISRLQWLASQMRQHNQTIFSLEDLQPDWVPQKWRLLYRWSRALLVGSVAGLLSGMPFGLVAGLLISFARKQFLWLFVGLLIGIFLGGVGGALFELINEIKLLLGRRQDNIHFIETFTWSWKVVPSVLVGALLGWLLGKWLDSLLLELAGGVLGGLVFGLVGGVSGKRLPERLSLSPNESVQRSVKNGLLIGLVSGLAGWLFATWFTSLYFGFLVGDSLGLAIALLATLYAGLYFGLDAVLHHFVLRFWLWITHIFPFKIVSFLEDATARILLRRVGGGYSFTHRLLLDYFADLDTTPNSSPGTHPGQPPPQP